MVLICKWVYDGIVLVLSLIYMLVFDYFVIYVYREISKGIGIVFIFFEYMLKIYFLKWVWLNII